MGERVFGPRLDFGHELGRVLGERVDARLAPHADARTGVSERPRALDGLPEVTIEFPISDTEYPIRDRPYTKSTTRLLRFGATWTSLPLDRRFWRRAPLHRRDVSGIGRARSGLDRRKASLYYLASLTSPAEIAQR